MGLLPLDILPASYRPCVLLGSSDVKVRVTIDATQEREPFMQCKEVLGQLWSDHAFSDCCIKCGDKTFQCHRAVLAAVSPVWRAALERDFQEKQERTINIQDANPLMVEVLLRCAYTGELELSSAIDVLPLAHYYQIPHLVARCANALVEQLSDANVVDVLDTLNKLSEDANVATVMPKIMEK